MLRFIRQTVVMLVLLSLITGLVYPLVVTGIAQLVFPHQANGSLVPASGKKVGSSLIAQNFTKPEYFHPRPSAAGAGYDAANSSGTNLGPLSDKLLNGVADDPKTKDVDESFAGVKQLVLSHNMARSLGPLQENLALIRRHYDGPTRVAEDLMCVD